jgi:serine/threonine-protein kinase
MRMDVQRAMSGMPVAAPTRLDMYQGTQQMGAATMMASPTTAVPPYDYAGEETGDEPPRRSHRALLWVLGLLVVLGAVGALAYLLLGGGGKTYSVPLVQGLPLARAEQQIAANHLKSTVVNRPSGTVTKGDVISTTPPGGNNVAANTVVTLFVSTGPQQVTVPNVTGESATAAASQLSGLGLNVTQKPDPASTAPKGQVTRQTPGGQTKVSPGSTVTIYVSGGAVQVPGVVGDSAATAEQILQGAGFQVVPKTVAGPASATPGSVFQQTPAGQSSAAQGSTVTIYIAAQPATPSPSATPSSQSPSPTPSPTNSGLFGGGGGGGGNGNGNAVNRITG